MFLLQLPYLLHVEIHHWDLGNRSDQVMQSLGQFLGMREEDQHSFLFIDELFDSQEEQAHYLATFCRCGENDIMELGFELEQQLLEICGHVDL